MIVIVGEQIFHLFLNIFFTFLEIVTKKGNMELMNNRTHKIKSFNNLITFLENSDEEGKYEINEQNP